MGENPYNGNMIFQIQLHYYHHIELKSTYFEIPDIHNLRKISKVLLNLFLFLKKEPFFS